MTDRERYGNGQFAPGFNGTDRVEGITEEEFDQAFYEAEADKNFDDDPEGSVHGSEGPVPKAASAEQMPGSAATPAQRGQGGAAYSEYIQATAIVLSVAILFGDSLRN